ncbi:MAG: hypothetical protein M1827_001713 [Pycnora praestabilis]|nr:MAG: hypothetical protein M1827_001713 [Pycnora praestabilis]
MSRKAQKASQSKQIPGEDDREDALQAVVLADSFETRFNPFTLERPRCLLPLANTPLIEYTLEFLANAGVEEIFVYCGAHKDKVEEYIDASKWGRSSSPFTKLEIFKTDSHSIGDVMRDLDHRDLINGDFLIVSGDVVSNLPLESALAQHRARRTIDKNAIMTLILREAGNRHRTKSQGMSPVFVIDPTKDRCLHYEEMHPRQSNRHISIDPDILSSHSEIDVRGDLIDCYIDICTPDVLALWTDSFDYLAPRKQFLYGVLKDYELNGKTIHTHIVDNHYATRVRNLQAYDAVSKDIISRWAYPLCPDSNLLQGQSYRLQRGNIYREEGVVLARSCIVKPRSVVGKDSSIGDRTVVGNCVIGRRCQIGKNVTIDGAYIWDDAVIGDNSEVRRAIVANEAVVGRKCRIEPGALLSYGVRLADGTVVQGTNRLARVKRKRNNYDDAEALKPASDDEEIVGKGGAGYNFVEDEESGDDDEGGDTGSSSGLIYNMSNLAISDSSISTLDSEGEEEEIFHHEYAGSFATTVSSENGNADEFYHDAASSIFDALQRGETTEVIQLELTGLRLANNASPHQVRHAVIAAIMRWIQQIIDSESVGGSEAVNQVLNKYKDLVEKTIFDKEKPEKIDQVDFLLLVQKDLIHRDSGESILIFTSKELYELEIIEEEGFEQWWEDSRSSEDDEMRRVRSQTQQFVEWLATAEEDSSAEEAESDDD